MKPVVAIQNRPAVLLSIGSMAAIRGAIVAHFCAGRSSEGIQMVKVPRNYMENDRTSTMLQSNVLSTHLKPAVQVLSTRGNNSLLRVRGSSSLDIYTL